MKILILGDPIHFEECQKKLGAGHVYSSADGHSEAKEFLDSNDLIFDFIIDADPQAFEIYLEKSVRVFLNTCKISLLELTHSVSKEMACSVFGFNGLPTLFNRTILEVAILHKTDIESLDHICKKLDMEYLLVDDRVGLVTPRVVSMIINEAYYTVQEGTATREDIDLAMKLGTNYPYGPFEWCQRIGVKHVYEVLAALYNDTKDERYEICPLLKEEYLKAGKILIDKK